jgi:hypothetical protein
MKYDYSSVNAQYPVLGMKLKTDIDKEKVKKFYKVMLKKRFLNVDLHSYYYCRVQTDKFIQKINRRHRRELLDISMKILETLGCSNFKVEIGTCEYHMIKCDTPFGERSIRALRFSYLVPSPAPFDSGPIGILMMGVKCAGLLNFKEENGSLLGVIEEDYTKHYAAIKPLIFAAFPILEELGATIEFIDLCDGC